VTTHDKIHALQGTRQHAIWMGESRNIAIISGAALEDNPAEIEWQSLKRGFPFQGSKRGNQSSSYAIESSDSEGGHFLVEQSSSPQSISSFQTPLLIQVFPSPMPPIFGSVSTLPMSSTFLTSTLMSPDRPSDVLIPPTESGQNALSLFLQSSKNPVAPIQNTRTLS